MTIECCAGGGDRSLLAPLLPRPPPRSFPKLSRPRPASGDRVRGILASSILLYPHNLHDERHRSAPH